jgi:hypothetical protein
VEFNTLEEVTSIQVSTTWEDRGKPCFFGVYSPFFHVSSGGGTMYDFGDYSVREDLVSLFCREATLHIPHSQSFSPGASEICNLVTTITFGFQ